MPDEKSGALSDFLAAERTFLAWIRTGLALMGLGFVVARFGLFLQELQAGTIRSAPLPSGVSFWFGTALIILGVGVSASSLWRYIRLIDQLKHGKSDFNRPSLLAICVAGILAVVGLAMAIYLISVHDPNGHEEKPMTSNSESGIITLTGHHSVDETVRHLQEALQAKGVKLFALVDHSGEAERAGLQMRPTKLLIFGSPKAGTPLMVASPTIAIDLPLKILVWEDDQGKVRVSYNSPAYLQVRHTLPQELMQNIAVVAPLAAGAAE